VANRHFGKVGDVWKHLPLCEVLAVERPSLYAETHAGSAAYAPVDDAERRYGVLRVRAADDPDVSGTRYATYLARALDGALAAPDGAEAGAGVIPGSALLAMLELGAPARYLLCDVDPESTRDLIRWAARLGLGERVEAVTGDGMAAIAAKVLDDPTIALSTVVHVDPYDPDDREPGSSSALELAAALIDAGAGVVYWYGFDAPARRSWAWTTLHRATGAALWCGDMLVTAADGTVRDDGHLGRATTPGTGFGVVLANVGGATLDRCAALGAALARAYDGAPLPDGQPGRLDLRIETTAG
jgi:23S rRNA (adenine2030-N6)-methyltransferase